MATEPRLTPTSYIVLGLIDLGGEATPYELSLKNEFKKMMRETRAENTKALRVSSSPLLPRRVSRLTGSTG